ncbi:hypothetical protein ACL58G_18335 [Massilia sp. GER05]|uniref:hypothetical protein n=1 Tax=Massilia sp. GER05 TaxID=3394605 RepID=UPI003F834CD1
MLPVPLKQLLPDSSFVNFEVRRLARPRIEWVGPDVSASFDPLDYAWCKPLESEDPSCYLDEATLAAGERYGGEALEANGGGVRCGIVGDFQIKGIGKNQLAGKSTDFWHSHGAASLEEAIQEAIWGEVCQLALPYGAARVNAIITTGTMAPDRSFTRHGTSSRALIVRDQALRPAHYMRAIFFDQDPHAPGPRLSDVERTKRAIAALPSGLAQCLFPDDQAIAGLADHHALNAHLMEMVRRFAVQVAAATAKRIVHGTLNASNCCVDGRWIDFGTISTVSDYGRLRFASAPYSEVTTQYGSLGSALRDLLFYVKKYAPGHIASKLVGLGELENHLARTYDTRLRMEMVKLTGIPEPALNDMPRPLVDRAFDVFRRIMRAGNNQPFMLDPPDWRMPEVMGEHNLCVLLRTIACCADKAQALEAVVTENAPAQHVQDLVDVYFDLRDRFVRMSPPGSAWDTAFVALNCMRKNIDIDELYRTVLEQSISALVKSRGDIPAYIGSIVRKASAVLSDESDAGLDLSYWCNRPVVLSRATGFTEDGRAVPAERIVGWLEQSAMAGRAATLFQQCVERHAQQ